MFRSFFRKKKIIERGLQSSLAHPPTINNNNSSISNNNHSTKSGTNSTKLATSDDHQPAIASIHRNGKSSTTSIINKAVAVPQINIKPTGKTLVNGELNENLIEFSIIDATDGDTNGPLATSIASTIHDKSTRNSIQAQKHKQTATDLNVIRANKTVVALSILVQHLTTNVSAFFHRSLRKYCI